MTQLKACLAVLAVLALAGVAQADIVAHFNPFGVYLNISTPTQPDPAGHPGVYETTISLGSTNATPNIASFDLWANGTVNGASGHVVQEGQKAATTATKFTVCNYAMNIPAPAIDPNYNPALDSYWIHAGGDTYGQPSDPTHPGPDGWGGSDMALLSGGIEGAGETYPSNDLNEAIRFQSLNEYRYLVAFSPGDVDVYPLQDWGPVLHLAFTGPSINLFLNTLAHPGVTTAYDNYLLVVPEPMTLALLAVGAAGLLRRRRRQGLRGRYGHYERIPSFGIQGPLTQRSRNMTQSRAILAVLAVVALVGVAQADITTPIGANGVRLTLTTPTQPDPAGHPGVWETTVSLSSLSPNIVSWDVWANGTATGANGRVIQEGKIASGSATKFSVNSYANSFPSSAVDPNFNPLLDSYWIHSSTDTYGPADDPAHPGSDGWGGSDLALVSGGIKGAVETYPNANLSESVRFQSLTDCRYSLAFTSGNVSPPYPIQDWGPVLHLAFTGNVNLHLETMSGVGVYSAKGDYLIPEPVTLALLAVGAAGLLRRRRR